MKQRVLVSVLLLLATASTLVAHDLFLKLDAYFGSPGTTLVVRLLNGTFSKSEGAVAKDRMRVPLDNPYALGPL
jgi:hypothetical protein